MKRRQYNVVRVIEYSGSLEWLESTLGQSAVLGLRRFGSRNEIREIFRSVPMESAMVEIPEIEIEEVREEDDG